MKAAPAPGVLLLSKPAGMTSRKAVDAVKRLVGVRRIGHTGTLDPFAEGLLIVLWGRATGLALYLQEYSKSYLATIRFGRSTDTQDRTGRVLAEKDPSGITEAALREALVTFVGDIAQVPPSYSAVKHQGRRSYALARRGETPTAPARTRHIDRFDLLEWDPPFARVRVVCSTGTYVRTLAHDLGAGLGPGACLEALTRSAIGPFSLDRALAVQDLLLLDRDEVLARALPPGEALPDWPALTVDAATVEGLANGIPGIVAERAPADRPVRVLDEGGGLVALFRGGPHPEFLRVFVGGDE